MPRLRDEAASCASFKVERPKPKPVLVASVPPMDWKTRSTGVPAAIRSITVVTWVRNAGLRPHLQPLAEIVEHADEIMDALRAVRGRVDAADGIAAAEQQAIEDTGQNTLRVIGRVVWLGCRREASRPGRPIVSRIRVVTRRLAAIKIRSWMRQILATAATISAGETR